MQVYSVKYCINKVTDTYLVNIALTAYVHMFSTHGLGTGTAKVLGHAVMS